MFIRVDPFPDLTGKEFRGLPWSLFPWEGSYKAKMLAGSSFSTRKMWPRDLSFPIDVNHQQCDGDSCPEIEFYRIDDSFCGFKKKIFEKVNHHDVDGGALCRNGGERPLLQPGSFPGSCPTRPPE